MENFLTGEQLAVMNSKQLPSRVSICARQFGILRCSTGRRINRLLLANSLFFSILFAACGTSLKAQSPTPVPLEVPSLSEMLGQPKPSPTPVSELPELPPLPPPSAANSGSGDPAPEAGQPSDPQAVPVVEDLGPSPIEPPIVPAVPPTPDLPVPTAPVISSTGALPGLAGPVVSGGAMPREFNGEEIATVLRILARQAQINLVVSDAVIGTITMRLENVTAFEAIRIICTAKNLFLTEIDNVWYVKTMEEKAAEPQESASFRFSYAKAEEVAPLLQRQLMSGAAPSIDARTNQIFYREVQSNLKNIQDFLESIDTPTKQVMIEARLVEVNANPEQRYGINWTGTLNAKQFNLFGSGAEQTTSRGISSSSSSSSTNNAGSVTRPDIIKPDGTSITGRQSSGPNTVKNIGQTSSKFSSGNIIFDPTSANDILQKGFALNPANLFSTIGGQFAILSAPQLSATLSLINQDRDAEFLANPRIVTSDNQEATIKITRNQPVPQLNFNEQTATAVFGGFIDKEFGNTLVVRPSINKDNFITLSIRPEISNKVGDASFVFAGAEVFSPIIDTRSLEANVLIRSGDTLAVGGLLQDEISKSRTKVPVLGDIPLVGYLFSERVNQRSKRDLLIFVTPTIIEQGYGTGLEYQMATGLQTSTEEYADPNGWLNNARGAIRLAPPEKRQLTTRYPQHIVPGSGSIPASYDTTKKKPKSKKLVPAQGPRVP